MPWSQKKNCSEMFKVYLRVFFWLTFHSKMAKKYGQSQKKMFFLRKTPEPDRNSENI